jgi:hypothetical protein
VISLTRTVWIAFRRGRGLLFLVFSLLLLGMMTSAVLGFEGILSVNGRAAPISDAMRIDFALGIGLRWINLFGMLIVLLVGPGLLLFWVASIGVLGGVLAWHEGIVRGTLVAGIPIFILGQLLLLGILLLFRMIVGGGWGAVVGVLIWVGSWLFSLDMLEGYLFDVNVPAEKAVWWMPLLGPYLEGEPIGPSATAARVLVRLFPPAGNVESVALDVALGKAVFPRSDWWSLPVAVVWMLLACLGVVALFRRKDL